MEEGVKRVENSVRQLLEFSERDGPEWGLTGINSMIEGRAPLFVH